MIKKSVLFLVLLFFVSNVIAFGITPGRITIPFEPNLEKNISFSVIKSENATVHLLISPIGELGSRVELLERSVNLSADEKEKRLNATIVLPSELSPGVHKALISVTQSAETLEGEPVFVGASASVVSEINVIVPYPGKYAEAGLDVVAAEDTKQVDFIIPILNRGKEMIESASANVEVYDSSGNRLITLWSGEIAVPVSERRAITLKWIDESIVPGNYKVLAAVLYDSNLISIERAFRVGDPVLEIEKVSVNNFKLGGIAKFEMLVNSKWGDTIERVSSKIEVFADEGNLIGEFSSPAYDLNPLGKETITSFWDSSGVGAGIYDSLLTLRYGEKSLQKNIKLDIKENSLDVIGASYVISAVDETAKSISLTTVLAVLVVLLIIANAVWFLFLRRKMIKGRK